MALVIAAAAGAALGAALVLFVVRREAEKASGELRRFRHGARNARVRTPLRALSGFARETNAVLEDAQSLEVENERAKRKMKNLLSGVSHDIRTPLTSIIGYLQALKDGVPESTDEEREFLDIVLAKAESIRSYSESVFRLARLEADGIGPSFVPVDLAELLRRSVLSFAPFLEGGGFTVDITIPERKCPAMGEEVSLLRVFQNLIGNAGRHGGDGKYLGIGLENGGDRWIVRVEDRGKGFSPDLMGRILGDSWGSENGARSGEGLGLSITKLLVEAHGGTFSLVSTPSVRTVVTVSFPACRG